MWYLEAQIAVHWREEGYVYPPTAFVGQANANNPNIRLRFTEDSFPECFKAAFIWVSEPEVDATLAITCQELHRRVNESAALLRDWGGVQAGDRVTFHLPMVSQRGVDRPQGEGRRGRRGGP